MLFSRTTAEIEEDEEELYDENGNGDLGSAALGDNTSSSNSGSPWGWGRGVPNKETETVCMVKRGVRRSALSCWEYTIWIRLKG